jgi:hypothetical protein
LLNPCVESETNRALTDSWMETAGRRLEEKLAQVQKKVEELGHGFSDKMAAQQQKLEDLHRDFADCLEVVKVAVVKNPQLVDLRIRLAEKLDALRNSDAWHLVKQAELGT